MLQGNAGEIGVLDAVRCDRLRKVRMQHLWKLRALLSRSDNFAGPNFTRRLSQKATYGWLTPADSSSSAGLGRIWSPRPLSNGALKIVARGEGKDGE
jgi:hypothetical protein